MGLKKNMKKPDGNSGRTKKKTHVFKSQVGKWKQERRDAIQLVRVKDRREMLRKRIAKLQGCLEQAEVEVKKVEARPLLVVTRDRMKRPIEGKRCDGGCGRLSEGVRCYGGCCSERVTGRLLFCRVCCRRGRCPECEAKYAEGLICCLCGSQDHADQGEWCGLLFCCDCACEDGIEF